MEELNQEIVCTMEQQAGDTRSLLKEIHHQVKNNLQVVCSLLRIQARSLDESDARSVFKRGEERIQCMALVYDALYRGEVHGEVPLHEYLPQMVRQLVSGSSTAGRPPAVRYDLQPVFVSSKAATYCGLLVNELISHRLRQRTVNGEALSISLRIQHTEREVEIELTDDGPSSVSSVGVAPVEQQILDALIKQLEGVTERLEDEGFKIRIAIPNAALSAQA